MNPQPIHTIVIYARPHIDPICAIFLLRKFGEKKFPGIAEAKIEFWNKVPDGKNADEWEQEGYLLIDLGRGKFDHHNEDHTINKRDCASTLVAKYLGIDQMPALKKLLQFVKRDDLEGRGIVSKDVIDRAFGLPAVVMNLNRDYPNHPEYVVDIMYRVFLAHFHEEYRRKVLMPREWEDIKAAGKAQMFGIPAEYMSLRVVLVESDSKTITGFLRAIKDVQADIVVQRSSAGHTNIVTSQTKQRIDLKSTIRLLRLQEAKKKGLSLDNLDQATLEKPGRIEEVEEWYFDTAANTLQNGGAATASISPTRLSLEEIKGILEDTLTVA